MNKIFLICFLSQILIFSLTSNASEGEKQPKPASATASPAVTPRNTTPNSRSLSTEELSPSDVNPLDEINTNQNSHIPPSLYSLPTNFSRSLSGLDADKQPHSVPDEFSLTVAPDNSHQCHNKTAFSTTPDHSFSLSELRSQESLPTTQKNTKESSKETQTTKEAINKNSKCCLIRALWRCLTCHCCCQDSSSS